MLRIRESNEVTQANEYGVELKYQIAITEEEERLPSSCTKAMEYSLREEDGKPQVAVLRIREYRRMGPHAHDILLVLL